MSVKTVGLFEAKTRLSELCREVATGGETIVISLRGRPVAELAPVRERRRAGSSLLDDLARFQASHPRARGEPEFPDVWRDRSLAGGNPLD